MSSPRQPRLTPADERFLIVRTMVAQCAPGLRTTSPTVGWHRLVGAAQGIIIVRTAQGQWSAPARNAVWVPAGMRAELETCVQTSLQMLYIRDSRAAWSRIGVPTGSRTISVGPLLREVIDRVAQLSALDRRVGWHVALAQLLLHEVRNGAKAPHELIWPRDPRAARVASLVQAYPADARRLHELCKGQGVSVRTVQRIFPLETGLAFEQWRVRFRFLHASRLLAEGRKVSEVAASCGYRSPSAFVVAFTRLAGVTPGKLCRTSS
jgi:AraC-like DNA-binding protein